jgi:hypothetical protein
MSIIFNWKIEKITKADDGFVTGVDYSVSATKDTKTESHSNSFKMVKVKEDAEFVPYNDLTEARVMGWIFAHIDKSAVESRLVKKLETLDDVTVSEFPWSVNQGLPTAP